MIRNVMVVVHPSKGKTGGEKQRDGMISNSVFSITVIGTLNHTNQFISLYFKAGWITETQLSIILCCLFKLSTCRTHNTISCFLSDLLNTKLFHNIFDIRKKKTVAYFQSNDTPISWNVAISINQMSCFTESEYFENHKRLRVISTAMVISVSFEKYCNRYVIVKCIFVRIW